MTETQLIVGPFNRVEGDLEIRLEIAEGRVTAAYANSPLFRGFESMMTGKAPVDALTIVPRICGICSISQSMAAAMALAAAAGTDPAPEGARVAALLHGVENVIDHLTHFNLFFMPDFARPCYADRAWYSRTVERFTAAEGSAIRQALAARADLMHVVGLLAGKWPHTLAIQPGGVTRAPTARDKMRIRTSLASFRRYLEQVLFGAAVEDFVALETPDRLLGWQTGDAGLFIEIAADLDLGNLGPSPGRYLSFGAYPLPEGRAFASGIWTEGRAGPLDPGLIAEDVSHSWMHGPALHPSEGQTVPDEEMTAPGYSWCKAPRLFGLSYETGAFARQVIDRHPLALAMAARGGVLARVAGRLIEVARTQLLMEEICDSIDPDAKFILRHEIPREGTGEGLVEAARGALGHWVTIERGRIARYQIVAPTTWNFSPRDVSGRPGPVEAALEGAPVAEGEDTPVSVQHIVRSFDPCMVCTVH